METLYRTTHARFTVLSPACLALPLDTSDAVVWFGKGIHLPEIIYES